MSIPFAHDQIRYEKPIAEFNTSSGFEVKFKIDQACQCEIPWPCPRNPCPQKRGWLPSREITSRSSQQLGLLNSRIVSPLDPHEVLSNLKIIPRPLSNGNLSNWRIGVTNWSWTNGLLCRRATGSIASKYLFIRAPRNVQYAKKGKEFWASQNFALKMPIFDCSLQALGSNPCQNASCYSPGASCRLKEGDPRNCNPLMDEHRADSAGLAKQSICK
jgi:hypothetical protein